MDHVRSHPSILVLGEGGRAEPLAAELRAAGVRTTVATTLSEVRELLATSAGPTLLIVDARDDAPWRADALERMTELVRVGSIPSLRIGGTHLHRTAAAEHTAELAADVSTAAIVSAARALLGAPDLALANGERAARDERGDQGRR